MKARRIFAAALAGTILCVNTAFSVDFDALTVKTASLAASAVVAENPKMIAGEAALVMAENDILNSLIKEGEQERADLLKQYADDALNFAAYDDKVKAREKTTLFCNSLEQAVLILSGGELPVLFDDVASGAWYYSAVRYSTGKGIFKGMDETHFAPDMEITRGMFLTLMGRLYKSEETVYPQGYSDISADAYYADAVNWAKAKGILSFLTGNEFCPDKAITREELVAVFRGCIAQSGGDTRYSNEAHFTDGKNISIWAQPAISWAAERGIISGFEDGSFRPKATATRAQVAQIFYNMADK